MKIKIYGEIYECEKALKGKAFVKLLDVDGNVTAEFRGIKDFAGYEVVEGIWSEAPLTIEEKQLQLDSAIAELSMMIAMGGTMNV